MRFDVERRRLSDLIGRDYELMVYDAHGNELRTLNGVIVRGGQTVREAIEAEVRAGEHVRARHRHTKGRFH
jgi:hypothetical protein